ncbi:MAG: hypothetical protein RDV48_13690 [Candidatus Eremiobacteraeota bacterium]|nr:hypothetical protein [Candidatus Eremiobacteraeota bacterium]
MKIHDSGPLRDLRSTPPLPPKKEETNEAKDSVELGGGSYLDLSTEEKIKKMREAIKNGVEAVCSGAEKTSEYLDKSPRASKALDTLLELFKTVKTFPRFIYPSLINMTDEEKALVLSQLDRLPLKDVGTVKSITMLGSLPGASGAAAPLPQSPFILLTKDNFHLSEDWANMVLTHETGHAVDYNSGLFGLPKLFSESSKSPWGKPPYISDYAATGPGWYPSEWDDFAESYANYHLKPEELKAKCPEKFKRMEELERNSFFESLVDRTEFRETGKLMGRIMEKAPYLQNGLAMVSLVGGLVQAFRALGEMKRGEKTGDEKLKMNATMNFAAGSCFASKVLAVPGMAIEGARSELNRAIENKEITASQANAVVQATVGLVAGPIGTAINWVISKLPWNKPVEINKEFIEKVEFQMVPDKVDMLRAMENKEFTKGDLKHLLKKLEFSDGERDVVFQYIESPKEPKTGEEVYTVNDVTLEHLKDKLPGQKLEALNVIKDDKYTGKELKKILKKADFDSGEIALITCFASETEKDPELQESARPGSLARAALIGAGGAAGAVGGGFVGPYLGILAGFAVAGPVGGIVGLIGGAVLGLKLGARLGGRLGNLGGKALEKIYSGAESLVHKTDDKGKAGTATHPAP